jgi:hypothetical protein
MQKKNKGKNTMQTKASRKSKQKKSAETHRKKMQIRNAKEKKKCKITIQKKEIKHAENAYDPGTPPEIEDENIWEMARELKLLHKNVSVVFIVKLT